MRGTRWSRDAINERVSVYNTSSNFTLSGVRSVRNRLSPSQPIALTSDENSDRCILECSPLETDGKGNFVDSKGRKLTLKGINVDGSMKLPTSPYLPSFKGDSSDPDNIFFEGENVTFVGRPFPLEEAESHFQRIKSWGYNVIRYLVTWEALEHSGPGKYDDEFIDYTIKILQVINQVGGLYVFFETHQDVWSRFCGGSGAPMWTLYAAGLQPRRFIATEAAILHNEPRFHDEYNNEIYPKMIWTSNYKRLASLVMFTLFFGGKNYFPNLNINGKNIQDFLQDHYFNAVSYFLQAITDGVPEMIKNGCILGFESMNEPNCGLIGHDHLGYIPTHQQLRIGTTPTVYQSMKLGMGFPCEVDLYRISITGPQKCGTKIIDPKGQRVWLTVKEAEEIDAKYDWKRSSKWKIGECIFAQEKIWKWRTDIDFETFPELTTEDRLNISRTSCELNFPNYFNQVSQRQNFLLTDSVPSKKIDIEYFINNNFVDFYIKHKEAVRNITPNVFVFMQPPVLEIPPNLKDDKRNIVDSKTVYCPHYYDGMSLMFKSWNTKYNVDTLGIMRGRYFNPVLGIVFGEKAIRNCIKDQFIAIKKESEEKLGAIPVLMSETGMPFDMDDKKAYEDGKYYSQTAALDAISYALESSNMSHTYWCYTSINCHKWGDLWNNEDFSFWSPGDRNLQFDEEDIVSSVTRKGNLKSSIKSIRSLKSSDSTLIVKGLIGRQNVRISDTNSTRSSQTNISPECYSFSDKESDDEYTDSQSLQASSLISCTSENVKYRHNKKCYPSPDGVRAVGAVIRPFVIATIGDIQVSEFDIKAAKFVLTISITTYDENSINSPTVIFVPKWHYPYLNYADIYLTSGHVKYNDQLEYLEWYHDFNYSGADSECTYIDTKSNCEVKHETIVIKNNSGSLDNSRASEQRGFFPCSRVLNCPIS